MNPSETLPRVASYQRDYQAIIGVLNDYFDGLYNGNVSTLRSIFHDDTVLKGNGYRRTRDEWLDAVANRPIPRDEGMAFDFNIQSLEIVDDQAMAKVDAPLLAAHFIDFLGLLKEDGQWRIVSKMFTTI